MFKTAKAITFLSVLAAGTAHAQFPGDVFVDQPSIIAQPGDTVQVKVQGFSGGIPFGASGAEISFDPALLEIVSIDREEDTGLVEPDALLQEPGRAWVAVVNGQQLDGPVGTVELSTLTFRVSDTASGFVPVTVTHRGYVSTDGTPLPFSRGFGASIFVQPPQSQLQASSSRRASSEPLDQTVGDSVLQARAAELRRPGFPVDVVDEAGSPRLRTLENIDPTAVSE